MNLLQKFNTTAFTFIVATLGIAVVNISPAKAATLFWDLEFFDESGTQVGDGEFSYDPEIIDTLAFSNGSVGNSEIAVDGLLETLRVNLFGEELISESVAGGISSRWWNVNSDTPTQSFFGVPLFGSVIVDEWRSSDFPTDPIVDIQAFTFSGNSSTLTTGEGEWVLDGRDVLGLRSPDTFPSPLPDSITSFLQGGAINGTWNASLRDDTSDPNAATTTPESSSIFSLLSLGLIGVLIASRKQ